MEISVRSFFNFLWQIYKKNGEPPRDLPFFLLNCLELTKFNVDDLKKAFDSGKITEDQYKELVNLYEKHVLADLDYIIKSLESKPTKPGDTSTGGSIMMENDIPDTLTVNSSTAYGLVVYSVIFPLLYIEYL